MSSSSLLPSSCRTAPGQRIRDTKLPLALIKRFLAVVPSLVSGTDADSIVVVLQELRDSQRRNAFIRTARSVINWRGQSVSAARQLGLLRNVPVLVAWGADETTIPPRHHVALAEPVPHIVMVEITDAGHYPHETATVALLPAIETLLRSTQHFRYSETRWVEQLTGLGPDRCAGALDTACT